MTTSRDNLIVGLDIGSTAIRIVAGQRSRRDEKIQIIGAVEAPASGISKGVINNIENAVSSISTAVEKLERMISQPVHFVWVGVSGSHIITQESRGVVAVSKPDGEIRQEDMNRAIEASKAVAVPPNYETLHVIPKSFTVDSQTGIKDPIGMTGIRLEAHTQIIYGLVTQTKNLANCIHRAQLDIEDMILSILAASESVLTNRQKDLGVVLVNIGGATTSLTVFEEGDILHTAVLPIGSELITNDIAICLRVSIETAEKIKIREGSCLAKDFKKQDIIKYSDLGAPEEGSFSKKMVAEIIEARVEDIMERVDKELKKVGKSGTLPAGVVITGGGAKIPGLVEVAKHTMRLPASLGYPQELISNIDKVSDLSFTTAIGLVLWGAQTAKPGMRIKGIGSSFEKTVSNIKKMIGSFLP